MFTQRPCFLSCLRHWALFTFDVTVDLGSVNVNLDTAHVAIATLAGHNFPPLATLHPLLAFLTYSLTFILNSCNINRAIRVSFGIDAVL